MINTVLLDMDGTLLPFEQEAFVDAYFRALCRKLAPLGYAPDDVVKAVWGGTKAMIRNDGTVANHDRFWDAFAAVFGEEIRRTEAMLDRFYTEEFHDVKAVLSGETCAKEIVNTLSEKGYTVVLATNPLFPAVAQAARLSWAGLSPDDFAHVTHYENSRFCKPNLAYYEEILSVIGKRPDECMMIGNSVAEDMIAEKLGMQTYLVTGFVENPKNEDTTRFCQGSLEDLLEHVKAMPSMV